MVIDTPYRLNVRITGNPTSVSVDGIPDGLYYHWNANRNRVQIRGTPRQLVDDVMVVTADDQRFSQGYSVYPIVPSYETNIVRTVTRGIPFTLSVPVDNAPTFVDIEGPYIGLKYIQYGGRFDLYGTIPENANFIASRFDYSVLLGNRSGNVPGVITLNIENLSDLNFYILDGNTIKVYSVVAPSEGVDQTVQKVKEFTAPSIQGRTANYVAIANDGTNLYLLHSAGPAANAADLDDQIVVVSPATQNGQTAGIIRRFPITRTSHYYEHDIDDIYYENGKLYIITSYMGQSSYQAYFVLEDIDGSDPTRIVSLLHAGGGISLTQGLLTAVLFLPDNPNQGNFLRVYPPSYARGLPLISDSDQTYTLGDPVRANFNRNSRDLSMTSINNYVYMLSGTLLDTLSVAEVPTPVGVPIRRNELTLSPALSSPNGITSL